MKRALDAVFENGTFRPLRGEHLTIADGQRVRITIEDDPEPEEIKGAQKK